LSRITSTTSASPLGRGRSTYPRELAATAGYLHGIHKTDISRALAKNRSFIRRRLMDQPEEPLPTQQTSET